MGYKGVHLVGDLQVAEFPGSDFQKILLVEIGEEKALHFSKYNICILSEKILERIEDGQVVSLAHNGRQIKVKK